MLLVIDVGNSNTVLGVYDDDRLLKDWRIRTDPKITEDEFGVLITGLFAGADLKPEQINKTVIASVVPPMADVLERFCTKHLHHSPVWVSAGAITSMQNRYDTPAEVGADRIVNAVAAFHKYGAGLIVIDFGTATTFDVVSKNGEYLGGAISPGIMVSAEALVSRTSKLPRVDLLKPPGNVIGKNTTGSIQSGILFGYASLVDGMVGRIGKELEYVPKVIATGGLAPLMQGIAGTIDIVDPTLTLEGLRLIGREI